MEKEQSLNYFKVIGKALLKIVLGLILLLLSVFAVAFVAIRIPTVQTKVAQKAAKWLSETLDHQVTIGRVDIEFFSNLVLEQVKVLDYQNKEMFYVGRLEADISAFSIFNPDKLYISTLELQQPRAALIRYPGTDSLNIATFINALNDLIVSDTTKPSKTFDFSIDEVVIDKGHFTYDDFTEPRSEHGMDYFHLDFKNISGRIDEIELGDTLRARIRGLQTVETRSNTKLHNLDVRMTYAPTFWEYDELDLRLNDSNLQNYVRFDYREFGDLKEFIDSVELTVNLKNSKVYARDVAVFAPQLRDYQEEVLINTGSFKGTVSNFDATGLDISYGNNTHIVGTISADGLPNWQETFFNMRLKNSSVNADDIKQFLPKDAYTVAARLGTVKLDGRFLGFYKDFVANGSFATALGNVQSDINLKIDDDKRTSSYRGYLKTNNFNLGRLIGNTDLIKTISMEGRLQGSGFTLETAHADLDVTVSQLHLQDYNYRNIKATGNLSHDRFIGQVNVNDPNLVFNADGEVFLDQSGQAFNMVANLERIDLQALKLTDQSIVISADANLNFKGLKLDEFEGIARFDSATIIYNGQPLALDSVIIDSQIAAGFRSLYFTSDLLAFRVNGDFNYSTLFKDLSELVEEYKLNFESSEPATLAYYNRKPSTLGEEYSLEYDIFLKHANPLIHLFVPELTISDFTKAEGTFRHGRTVILSMFSQIDTIIYDELKLYQNNLELNTSKLQLSPDVLASLIFTSEQQRLPTTSRTQDFYLEGIWSERTINFNTSARQPEQNNRATISGDMNFLEDQLQVVFNQSNIVLLDNPWVFSPGNTILISEGGKRIVFENFAVANQEQIISAKGLISNDPDSKLLLNVANLDLRNLNPLITEKISGTLHGKATIQDLFNRAIINTTIRIDSLHMDDFLIGNVSGRSDWNNAQKQLAIDVGVVRNWKKVMSITGNYYPQATEDELDLLAVMDDAQIKIFEPFLRPIMSDLSGTMEGRIRILGTLSAPVLKGSAMVSNGRFMFDYLRTTYQFSDRIYFSPNSISFRNARLRDIYGNTATVTGGIAHDGFENMVLDISARYRNFMVLNTTAEHNELYYGTAFATGTASVLGPIDNMRINVDARSEENTRIVVPLDNQENIARKDFIKFVNRNISDSTGVAVAVEEQRVDLSGINMNFNLDVTEDAYFEIIIDRTTGDIIRGSGSGKIAMTIDTRGEFNMFGTFEIARGAYNLNLLEGLVTREFRVLPGGTISWNGDPLEGLMNITATYTQMASLSGLESTLQGRYPITAIVTLTGPLLTPTIDLDLNFDEIPPEYQLSGIVNSIANDESELNRQVFSLLVLRRLSPQGTFNTVDAGSAAVGGSLGSLLTNQLSTFFSSIDNNLEIDIGLDGISQEALANLQLRLSYTFFGGRLRVTSESGLGDNSQLAGAPGALNRYQSDWSVEYYITQSGELRARLEYNTIPRGLTTNNTSRQSISLLHTKRFDNLRELFGSRRSEARLREREQIILDSDPRMNF